MRNRMVLATATAAVAVGGSLAYLVGSAAMHNPAFPSCTTAWSSGCNPIQTTGSALCGAIALYGLMALTIHGLDQLAKHIRQRSNLRYG